MLAACTMLRPRTRHSRLLGISHAGVGKSCIILRYTTNKFSTSYITTIGIDFKNKVIDIGDKKVQLDVSLLTSLDWRSLPQDAKLGSCTASEHNLVYWYWTR